MTALILQGVFPIGWYIAISSNCRQPMPQSTDLAIFGVGHRRRSSGLGKSMDCPSRVLWQAVSKNEKATASSMILGMRYSVPFPIGDNPQLDRNS